MMSENKCGAKHSRGECGRHAGWGTDHVGAGRCKKHDITGLSGQLVSNQPTIKSLAEELKKDGDPFELRDEIALTRAMLIKLIEAVDEEGADLSRSAPSINQLLNTTGRLVQRLHEIEVGRRYVVRVDQVQASLQVILGLVLEYIPNPADRATIAEKISSLTIDSPNKQEAPLSLTAGDKELSHLLRTTQDNSDGGTR